MDPRVRMRSTWRDPIGKPLTDSAILRYMRNGRYGPELQRAAREAEKAVTGSVFRCDCGARDEVRYMTYSYLPRPGYFCPACRARYREGAQREKEQRKEWASRFV